MPKIKTNIKWTEELIQVALTQHKCTFDFLRFCSAPNVINITGYECDLLTLYNKDYFIETEIKTSVADLRKDSDKPHQHKSDLIKFAYFAITEEVYSKIDLSEINNRFGVIVVSYNRKRFKTKVVRRPKANIKYRKPTEDEIYNFFRLSMMRFWNKRSANEALKASIKL
jgi:hypothetical protein